MMKYNMSSSVSRYVFNFGFICIALHAISARRVCKDKYPQHQLWESDISIIIVLHTSRFDLSLYRFSFYTRYISLLRTALSGWNMVFPFDFHLRSRNILRKLTSMLAMCNYKIIIIINTSPKITLLPKSSFYSRIVKMYCVPNKWVPAPGLSVWHCEILGKNYKKRYCIGADVCLLY